MTFATGTLNLQVSHNSRETFSLFWRTAGTADPLATLNVSLLLCCLKITGSLFGSASKPQRLLQSVQGQETGGEILWGFTRALLCSKPWHVKEQFIVQSYMVYMYFLPPQVTYSRLFLRIGFKTAGFTLSEGTTGY